MFSLFYRSIFIILLLSVAALHSFFVHAQPALPDEHLHGNDHHHHHRHHRERHHHREDLTSSSAFLSHKEHFLCRACEMIVIPALHDAIIASEAAHKPVETTETLLEKLLATEDAAFPLFSASLSPSSSASLQPQEEGVGDAEESRSEKKSSTTSVSLTSFQNEKKREWFTEYVQDLLWDAEALRRLAAVQILYHRYPDRRKLLDPLLHYVACACGDDTTTASKDEKEEDTVGDSNGEQSASLSATATASIPYHDRRRAHQHTHYHLHNRGFRSMLEKHAAVLRRLHEEDSEEPSTTSGAGESDMFSEMLRQSGGGGGRQMPRANGGDTLESRLGMPGFGGMATGREQQGEEL